MMRDLAGKQEEALSLLTGLLSIGAVNGRHREGALAEFLHTYFETHGIRSHVQEIDLVHSNVIAFIPGRNPDVNHNGGDKKRPRRFCYLYPAQRLSLTL